MKVQFTEGGGADYVSCEGDRRMLRRINRLIQDVQRGDESGGIGKPELLRGDLAGWSSRRIDEEHRLVYRVRDDFLVVIACRHHY